MDIPSSHAGTVKELKVKVGDKVAKGTLILLLEEAASAAPEPKAAAPAPKPEPAPAKPAAEAKPAPSANTSSTSQPVQQGDLHAEVVVLGSGPGGYTAAFRAADLGKKVVLIERYSTLGGVCLNVGCIPSKALLHAAKVVTEAEEMAEHGISFGQPKIDIDKLREWKAKDVVAKLTGGLGQMAKQREVTTVIGVGEFTSPNQVKVTAADGKVTTVPFENAILAPGSQAINIPGAATAHRTMDTTAPLEY